MSNDATSPKFSRHHRSHIRRHLFIALPVGATLFVAVLAFGLYLKFFPPYFRGAGELTDGRSIAGWVVNEAAPSSRSEVQLYIDNHFVASRIADLPRPDVVAAGFTKDERCGYWFDLPPLAIGEHEARVFAMHKIGAGTYRTLQLTMAPVRFTVDAAGDATVPNKMTRAEAKQ